MRQRWDIFCAVVDNFGDIATCWRLARHLHLEHGQAVRLWVDDLATMQRLAPDIRTDAPSQWLDGIEVRHWPAHDFPDAAPASIVIEAFACALPASYLQAMRDTRPLWINLEYFSAEDWVAGCHGLPSMQGHGLQKYFFFPGIQPGVGGLLRERDLIERRDGFLRDPASRHAWCARWNMPEPAEGGLRLSLFTYEHPALPEMLRALGQSARPVDVYVPAGRTLNSLAGLFADPGKPMRPGQTLRLGNLALHVLPFLPQSEYDHLLWLCDINFVRGEESLSRAIWSGKPFIWHVYPTEDLAHRDKMRAFVNAYAQPDAPAVFEALMQAWNDGEPQLTVDWLADLNRLERHTSWFMQRGDQLAQADDLASQLVKFAASKLQSSD